jgi:hypothetical protein
VLPHTIWLVERWTERNRLGEGVNNVGSSGSSVIVGRNVGVGIGVSGIWDVPSPGVVDDSGVLSSKRSGVNVGAKENGVAVCCGMGVGEGPAVPRNGMETGRPLQPERRKIRIRRTFNFFIRPLR